MLELKRLAAITAAAISLAVPATAVAQYQDLRSADARDAAHQAEIGKQRTQDLRNADRRTDTGVRVPQVAPPAPPTVQRVEIESGFDWGDAGIGAAGGLAILTLAGGMAAVATRRRREHRVAA